MRKTISKDQEQYKAIVAQLLRYIYGLDLVIRDMEKGPLPTEELEAVHAEVEAVLDNFGIPKEGMSEQANEG